MNSNNLPDLTVVKGVVTVALGIALIVFAYSIVIHATCFVAGLGLVYCGLRMLNIPAVNSTLATVRSYCQRLLS